MIDAYSITHVIDTYLIYTCQTHVKQFTHLIHVYSLHMYDIYKTTLCNIVGVLHI